MFDFENKIQNEQDAKYRFISYACGGFCFVFVLFVILILGVLLGLFA